MIIEGQNQKQEQTEQDNIQKRSGLVVCTKRAREFAYLGMYEESSRSYADALNELRNRKNLARNNPELIEGYTSLQKDLEKEIRVLKSLWDIVKTGRSNKIDDLYPSRGNRLQDIKQNEMYKKQIIWWQGMINREFGYAKQEGCRIRRGLKNQ